MDKQYVIFKLNKEEYGVNIENVREITEYKGCISVPLDLEKILSLEENEKLAV